MLGKALNEYITIFVRRSLSVRALCAAVLVFSGCWAVGDYHAYVGMQKTWPTSAGSYADTVDGIPVFYNFPPRPYVVLGYLDAKTAPIRRHSRLASRRDGQKNSVPMR
jgi:hypothetical protein